MKLPLENTSPQHNCRREIVSLVAIAAMVILVVLVIKLIVFWLVYTQPEEASFLSSKAHIPNPTKDTRRGTESLDSNTPAHTAIKYIWQPLPDKPPEPLNNRSTPEKVALGKMLFNDRNLSLDRSIACADCHELFNKAGTDNLALSQGIGGQQGERNAPSVWNSAFQRELFWDGRADSLEEQAIQPLINPVEMGMTSFAEVVARVKESRDYQARFRRAFPDQAEIGITEIAKAIASYERTLVTNDSPYDDYVRGDKHALNSQLLNGMTLFNRVGCTHCHSGPNFSAASVFSTGLARRIFPANPSIETSGYSFISQQHPQAAWRIPSLRNVALTGPWLHNGEVDNLHDVVRLMASYQLAKQPSSVFQWTKGQLHSLTNPALTEEEVGAIVAFLEALSSRRLLAASKLHTDNKEAGKHL